jgi:hypothetical protein
VELAEFVKNMQTTMLGKCAIARTVVMGIIVKWVSSFKDPGN